MTVKEVIELLAIEDGCMQKCVSGDCDLLCNNCEFDHNPDEVHEAIQEAIDYIIGAY